MGGGSSKQRRDAGVYDVNDEEDTGRDCCGCFAKGILSTVIILMLVPAAGLSAASIIWNKDDYWTYFDTKGAAPGYRVQTGWLTYHIGGDDALKQSLRELSFALWVVAWACLGMLGVSFVMALIYIAIVLFGKAGRHIRILALPIGFLLGGVLAAYYILAALELRQLIFDATKQYYLIWPNYGWCFGMGAAVLWILSAMFSCCIPSRKSRDYVKQHSPRQSQTGNPVYRVRTFSNASDGDAPDTENAQPLNVKQPGVLNVDAPPSDLDPDAHTQSQSSTSKSWLSRSGKGKLPLVKKTVREGYHDRSSEIAKRYGSEKMV